MDLDIPLYYHRHGLMPVPINGKVAIQGCKWGDYIEAIASSSVIESWFKSNPDSGLAIVTGPVSKIIVLDLDGQKALDAVSSYPIPKTWIAKTPKGYHYYFQWDDKVDFPTTITKLNEMGNKKGEEPKWGVDVRGRGGYVVAPPSYDTYSWITGYSPSDVGLAPIPEWLMTLLLERSKKNEESCKPIAGEGWLSELLDGVGDGERHTALARLSGYYFSRMPPDIARHHLVEWNEKNVPPITNAELTIQLNDFEKKYSSGTYKSNYSERKIEPVVERSTKIKSISLTNLINSKAPARPGVARPSLRRARRRARS